MSLYSSIYDRYPRTLDPDAGDVQQGAESCRLRPTTSLRLRKLRWSTLICSELVWTWWNLSLIELEVAQRTVYWTANLLSQNAFQIAQTITRFIKEDAHGVRKPRFYLPLSSRSPLTRSRQVCISVTNTAARRQRPLTVSTYVPKVLCNDDCKDMRLSQPRFFRLLKHRAARSHLRSSDHPSQFGSTSVPSVLVRDSIHPRIRPA